MDIIDDVVEGKVTRHGALKPAARRPVPLKDLYRHLKTDFYRQYLHNWSINKPLLYKTIKAVKTAKRKIVK